MKKIFLLCCFCILKDYSSSENFRFIRNILFVLWRSEFPWILSLTKSWWFFVWSLMWLINWWYHEVIKSFWEHLSNRFIIKRKEEKIQQKEESKEGGWKWKIHFATHFYFVFIALKWIWDTQNFPKDAKISRSNNTKTNTHKDTTHMFCLPHEI